MIPVPDSELILYEPKYEKNKNYKIFANIIYNQKNNGYDVSYIKNVVDFKLLEEKCREYKNNK